MKIESTELEDYIKSSLTSIKKGVHADGSFRIQGMIEFDLAVINTKEKRGGLKIYVVGVGGKFKSQQISRIRFRVKPYADEKLKVAPVEKKD